MTRTPHAAVLFVVAALAFGPAQADSLQDAKEYLSQGQYEKALQAADSYVAGHPRNPDGRLLKGSALAQLGRSGEAVQVYAALIRDYPTLPEPRNNLAVLYASLGQYDKAQAELEAAMRTHPSYAAVYDNLGEIYTRMASLSYDRALGSSKNPSATPPAHLALMTAFTRQGGRNEPLHIALALPASPQAIGPARPAATMVAAAPAPAARPAPLLAVKPAAPAHPATVAPPPRAPVKPPVVVAAAPVKPAERPIEKPVEKPAERPAAKPREADETEALLQAVNGWARAWSSKNVGAYLGYYAREFKPPKGASRAAWEKARHDRISAPKSIKVTITSPKVHVEKDGSRASVTFRQGYEAGALVNTTTKTLEMVRVGKRWMIAEERIGR